MTDWNHFFKQEEFRQYRKQQARLVSRIINSHMSRLVIGRGANINELNGQMSMAKHLLELPEQLTKDEGVRTLLTQQLEEDIADMTRYLIKHRVEE